MEILYCDSSRFGTGTGSLCQFLYKVTDKIFLMDNHKLALWCWCKYLDNNKKYDLIHIDHHYDLDCQNEEEHKYCLGDIKNMKISNFSLNEYIDFANYINTIPKTFFNNCYFIVIEEKPSYFEYKNADFIKGENTSSLDELEELLKQGENKIVNIDADYFFKFNEDDEDDESKNKYIKSEDYEKINELGSKLKEYIDKIDIITIAISPYYCDAYNDGTTYGENSKDFIKKILSYLSISDNEIEEILSNIEKFNNKN